MGRRSIVTSRAAGCARPNNNDSGGIAKELTERVKQPVVVENKPGAGGTIGADLVAKAPPVANIATFGLILIAPAGTPQDIVTKLNTEVNAIIRMPEIQQRWTQMGIDRMESTPEQLASRLARESDQWALLIRTQGHQARVSLQPALAFTA